MVTLPGSLISRRRSPALEIDELEGKILEVEDRVNSQDETRRDAAAHANAGIAEAMSRIEGVENQKEQMSWSMIHGEISRLMETGNSEFDV